MSSLTRIVAGGTGVIGQAIVNRWLKRDINVTVLTRDKEKAQKLFPNLEDIITWDELNIEHIGNAECIINLSGENIGEKAWTDDQKARIISSRVEPTHKLSKLCAELGPDSPRIFNASAVGIYGAHKGAANKLGKTFSEDSELEPQDDFLYDVASKWEAATQVAVDAGVNVVLMRFGIILSDTGGALPEFAKMARSFVGTALGTGHQPMSWMHIYDVCAAIEKLIEHPEVQGAVNFVAPQAIQQEFFMRALCRTLNKPYWRKPFWKRPFHFFMDKMLGTEKFHLLLLTGQNVKPNALLKIHFDYIYPEINAALGHIFK